MRKLCAAPPGRYYGNKTARFVRMARTNDAEAATARPAAHINNAPRCPATEIISANMIGLMNIPSYIAAIKIPNAMLPALAPVHYWGTNSR